MGNFIEGTFRAHGTKDSIHRFIMESLEPPFNGWNGEEEKPYIQFDGETYWMMFPNAYLDGTSGQFIKPKYNPFEVYNVNPEKEDSDWYMFVCDYLGQWEIDCEGIVRLAKEYCVGIRVNGYDCNTMKEELLEVNSDGEVTQYHIETYRNVKDWLWNCPMPNLGG